MIYTLFYVEDDPEEIILMEFFFKPYKDQVTLITFENGVKFLEFLHQKNQYKDREKKEGFYCILLDINLPYLNGFDLLKELKTSNDFPGDKIPIVMFSSSPRALDKSKSHKLGAIAHIQKPLDYEGMEMTVKFVVQEILMYSGNLWVEV